MVSIVVLVDDLPADDNELELEHPGDALPHELGHCVAADEHVERTTVRRRRRHPVHPFPPRLEQPPLGALQLGSGARERLAEEPELGVQRRGAPDAAGSEVAVADRDGERDVVRERRAAEVAEVVIGEREAAQVRVLDGDAGGEDDGVGYDEHGDERGHGDGDERRDEDAAALGVGVGGAAAGPAVGAGAAAGPVQAAAVAGAAVAVAGAADDAVIAIHDGSRCRRRRVLVASLSRIACQGRGIYIYIYIPIDRDAMPELESAS